MRETSESALFKAAGDFSGGYYRRARGHEIFINNRRSRLSRPKLDSPFVASARPVICSRAAAEQEIA